LLIVQSLFGCKLSVILCVGAQWHLTTFYPSTPLACDLILHTRMPQATLMQQAPSTKDGRVQCGDQTGGRACLPATLQRVVFVDQRAITS
jgi:hypothetical protein